MYTLKDMQVGSLSGPSRFSYSSITNLYYIASNKRLIVFDTNWQYRFDIVIGETFSMVFVDNHVYFGGLNKVRKYSVYSTSWSIQDQPIISSASFMNVAFSDIDYDEIAEQLITIDKSAKIVYRFGKNLSLIDSLVLTQRPYCLKVNNNKIFIGTYSNSILIIDNKSIINTYSGIGVIKSNYITSIAFDKNGYLLASCDDDKALLLYDKNMIKVNYMIKINLVAYSIHIDSKGRLIVIAGDIMIYY